MLSYAVPVATRPVQGDFGVPPSKSIHQRALLLATLSDVGWVTRVETQGPAAQDVLLLAGALSSLAGCPVPTEGAVPGAVGPDGRLGGSRDRVRCDLGMNATGLRLLAAAAGLRPIGARTLLTGRPRLRARPHGDLLRAIRSLGGHAQQKKTGAVRVLGASWSRHEVAIRADRSSQPASALLLAAPRAGGLSLTLVGPSRSSGYLALSESVLAAFGVVLSRAVGRVDAPAGTPRCDRFLVEPDASSAAVWWAAAALTRGSVRVPGLASSSRQPDLAALAILARMGAHVAHDPNGVPIVTGPGRRLVGAGAVDLGDSPDLAPLVGALAAGAEGETRVVGAPHLRDKESDRVATTVAAIRAIGGDAEPTDDGFLVRGRPLVGGRVAVAGDHRIALAFGVLGLAVPGVVLDGAEAVAKSYPGFVERLAAVAGTRSEARTG